MSAAFKYVSRETHFRLLSNVLTVNRDNKKTGTKENKTMTDIKQIIILLTYTNRVSKVMR